LAVRLTSSTQSWCIDTVCFSGEVPSHSYGEDF
jgi:hypothetical protein